MNLLFTNMLNYTPLFIILHHTNSDPMRITKKFAGASCIGKQVFAPHMTGKESEILLADAELEHLRGIFLEVSLCLGWHFSILVVSCFT